MIWELTGSTLVIMGKILGESYPHAKGDGCRQSTSTGTMIHINDPWRHVILISPIISMIHGQISLQKKKALNLFWMRPRMNYVKWLMTCWICGHPCLLIMMLSNLEITPGTAENAILKMTMNTLISSGRIFLKWMKCKWILYTFQDKALTLAHV